MSRSYKKFPVCKDNGRSKKQQKQIANRIYRRYMKQELSRYGEDFSLPKEKKAYRKNYESYDIADYVSYWPLSDLINYYYHAMIEKELTGVVPYFEWKHPEIDSLEKFINYAWKRGPHFRK